MHRKRFFRTTAVIALLLCSLPGLAASRYWATANPLSDSHIASDPDIANNSGNLDIWGTYSTGSGTTIAVGERGAILTGTNNSYSIDWVARQSGLTIDLNDVIFDGTRYIAVGWDGVIVTSTDLANWTDGNVGAKLRLRAIAYAKFASTVGSTPTDHYVVVGDNGSLLTSTDASTWTAVDSGTGMALLDVLWDSYRKQFIAVGGGSTGGLLLTSDDGQTWTQRLLTSRILHGIGINNTGQLVIVGDKGLIYTSSNGSTWTPLTPPTNQDLYAVDYDSTHFKYITVGSNGTILISSDGNTWNPVYDSGTGNNLYAVTWNGTNSVAAGTNSLLTPTDATLQNWQFGTSPISDGLNLTGIATNDSGTTDVYLAVSATGQVFSSNDGLAWTAIATTAQTFTTVIWDGSQYVAIDSGNAIVTSSDGITWTPKTATGLGTGLNGIAYSGSTYVVVGNNDVLLRSADLSNWSAPNTPAGTGGGNLTGITWNPDANNSLGEFLVVTNQSKVLHGSGVSGQTWSAANATEFRINQLSTALNAVAWNGSQYVASGPLGAIVYSDNGNDGNDWQHVAPADTFRSLNDVTWAPGLQRFITVGDNGIVMVSGGVDMGVFAFSQNTSATIATEQEPFGYSFVARNNGNFYASNIVMTVTLPSTTDATLGQYDSRCSETVAGLMLSCTLGNMEGGGGVSTAVYVQVTPASTLVHTDLAVTVDVSADGPEALPNDNQVITATYVQSIEDKIAKNYNSKVGGIGSSDSALVGLLLVALLMTVQRQRRCCRSGRVG